MGYDQVLAALIRDVCMSDPDLTTRAWMVDLVPDEVRIRCSYRRRRKRIVQYTVQLEIYHAR